MTSSRSKETAEPVRGSRALVSSRSTTSVSRSTWVRAMVASSFTVSGSSVRVISSRRMDSAVSGVRSWWEASAASRRSAVSIRAMRSAEESSTSATRSSSGTPYRLCRGRGSPEPSRSAVEARSVSGEASRLAWRTASSTAATIASSATSPMISSVRPTSRVTVDRGSSTWTVSPSSPRVVAWMTSPVGREPTSTGALPGRVTTA